MSDKLFPGEMDVFCPSCGVCNVLTKDEISHTIPDIWRGKGKCFRCGADLPRVEVKLYASPPS